MKLPRKFHIGIEGGTRALRNWKVNNVPRHIAGRCDRANFAQQWEPLPDLFQHVSRVKMQLKLMAK